MRHRCSICCFFIRSIFKKRNKHSLATRKTLRTIFANGERKTDPAVLTQAARNRRQNTTLDLYFSPPASTAHQFTVVYRKMVSLNKMGVVPAGLVLLALCVAGVWSNEAQDAWASRQRRVQATPNGDGQKKFSGRIVGGTELTEPLPYLLSLRDSGFHICGASIINAKHALSAAHCQSPPSDVNRVSKRALEERR